MTESLPHTGRVKFYDAVKAFGFAEDFDAGEDIYLGPDALLVPPLAAGDLVRFTSAPPSTPGKSRTAHAVERIDASTALALRTFGSRDLWEASP